MKWIDLQEREPEIGQLVVVRIKPGRNIVLCNEAVLKEHLAIIFYGVFKTVGGDGLPVTLTHWYPLPPLTQPDPVDEPLRAGDTLEWNMKTSIIIPSRGRAAQLIERVNILLRTVQGRDAEVVIISDGDEETRQAIIAEMQSNAFWQPNAFTLEVSDERVKVVANPERQGPIQSWNNGLRAASGEALVLAADDVIFHDGWLEEALKVLETLPGGDGVVALNDDSGLSDRRGFRRDLKKETRRYTPHFLITRATLAREMNGVLCFPAYQNYYTDVETCARAQAAGCYGYAPLAHVEHTHWELGKAQKDPQYETGDAHEQDLEVFLQREAAGFPDDFEPIVQRDEAARRVQQREGLIGMLKEKLVKTSIIIPSKGRPVQLIERVGILLRTLAGIDAEVIIVADADDAETSLAVLLEMDQNPIWQPNALAGDAWEDARVILVESPAGLGPHGAWNNGLRLATGDVFVPGADDALFHEGWLEAALTALSTLPGGEGLVGLNDGSGRGDVRGFRYDSPAVRKYTPFFLVSRGCLARELHGLLCVEKYGHYYMDVEACARAQAGGRYVYAPDSRVEHMHWQLGKAEQDETYQTGPAYQHDLAIYLERERTGFPDDFEPIVTADEPAPPALTRSVSVIIPSRGRPDQLVKCVDQLFASVEAEFARGLNLEVVIVIDDDPESLNAVKDRMESGCWLESVVLQQRTEASGPMSAWNDGLRESHGEIVVLGADDLWFAEGWLTYALQALETLPDSDGLVGLNDASGQDRDFATHYLATRRWLAREQHGCLVVPLYQRQFIDPEACFRAQISGRYAFAVRSVVEHRHYLWGKSDRDITYALNTNETFTSDQELFQRRKADGFPNNFAPVIPLPRVFWYVPRDVVTLAPAAIALENVAAYNAQRGYTKIDSAYTATDRAREGATQIFLELSQSPDDWLCMLDNDHVHPENIVEALTSVGNVGAVGALVRRRGDEFEELIYRRDAQSGQLMRVVGWEPGELVQVDSMGGGAFAVRRWVFDKLIEKYEDRRWFWRYAYNASSIERPGEECYFWRMMEDSSIPMAVDTSIISPHLFTTTVETLYRIAEAAAKGKDWKKVL